MPENDPNWKFDQAKNVGAITTKQVLEDRFPILEVIHFGDDCSWAFLCGTTEEESDARMVSMEQMVQLDPSILSISDLPPAHVAVRESQDDEWERFEEEEED